MIGVLWKMSIAAKMTARDVVAPSQTPSVLGIELRHRTRGTYRRSKIKEKTLRMCKKAHVFVGYGCSVLRLEQRGTCEPLLARVAVSYVGLQVPLGNS